MQRDLFVDRVDELNRLSSVLAKRSASLIVVSGRRRIGKSRLIEEFAKGRRFLAFTGTPPTEKTTRQMQRDLFARQLGAKLGLQSVGAQDWGTLFSLLAKYTEQGPVTILLDEISWMGSKDPTFLGQLKNAWDLEWKKNPELILVLCGSVSTWINKNIISSTAFIGRISLFLDVEELPLHSCHDLLLSRGFHQSIHEEFKILAVTGGIPWYLEHIQSSSADDNLMNLCFRKEGVLFNEFDRIFNDLFEKRSPIYQSIVTALAKGALEFTAICHALGRTKGGTLSGYLDDLIQAKFISKDNTWTIKSGKSSNLCHYRLSDNFLRFYLKVIEPNRDRILRGGFSSASFLSGWYGMMGLQFENLVLKNRRKIWKQLGIRPEDIVADNPYFQRKTSTKGGCQIDYLIQTRLNTLFACEIKFSMSPLRTDVIGEMKKKIATLPLPKRFSCWPVLIHVNGVEDSVLESDYFTKIIDFSTFLTPYGVNSQ
jgi:hypothetical protein